jgi:putative oxidoreductase
MNRFPFLPTTRWLLVLRVMLGLYMAAHGVTRTVVGTVADFGGFLSSQGIPLGVVVAWGITALEVLGGATLARGWWIRPVAAAFTVEHVVGIILVHARNGWFTVGYQSGGAEYSVLLVACFLTVASTARSDTPTHDAGWLPGDGAVERMERVITLLLGARP